MEKKNVGTKITLVILSLLVVGLAGYIVYDKVLSSDENIINNDSGNNNGDEDNTSDEKNNNDNTVLFSGEYLHQLNNGAKVYTDYTNNGSYYYKRVESDGTVSTYGYGIYTLNNDVLITKIVFGIDITNNSIVKSVTPESKYKVNNNSIEYDASGTSGQNYLDEKISDKCNIIKEVTSYLYDISKNNDYNSNFIYQ